MGDPSADRLRSPRQVRLSLLEFWVAALAVGAGTQCPRPWFESSAQLWGHETRIIPSAVGCGLGTTLGTRCGSTGATAFYRTPSKGPGGISTVYVDYRHSACGSSADSSGPGPSGGWLCSTAGPAARVRSKSAAFYPRVATTAAVHCWSDGGVLDPAAKSVPASQNRVVKWSAPARATIRFI
jgi:hypothetical protein